MYKFIKIKGEGGARTGYFVPKMYHLSFDLIRDWKYFGSKLTLLFLKDRLTGWTIWWVRNEEDYRKAIETLNELKKTRIFDYKVLEEY